LFSLIQKIQIALVSKNIALRKSVDHVEYERAIHAIRFSDENGRGHSFIQRQIQISFLFINHLEEARSEDKVIRNKGKVKFRAMIEHLVDDDKILKTN